MDCFLFRLNDGFSVLESETELKKYGLQDSYIIEDDLSGTVLIGGMASHIDGCRLKTCQLVEIKKGVSWTDQWSLFAEEFRDGKAHINLSRFGADQTLLLLPGAGFGDLSHPTTYLMLELMQNNMLGQIALDIGCGSGILSLSALLMGAQFAYGIDIDPAAISHAKQNASLNHLEKRCQFSEKLPIIKEPGIVLMNMILPEQKFVIEENPSLPGLSKLWITSGILESQKKEALDFLESLGLRCLKEKQRGEWIAFELNKAL